MGRIYLRLLFLLLLFAVGSEASEPLAPVKLLEPKDNTLYIGELATVVIKASANEIDTVTITLDNNKSYKTAVTTEKETYCKSVRLQVGENTLTLSTYLKGNKLQESKLKLFYLPELYEGLEDEPEDFDTRFFHTDENEKVCASCHNMTSNIPEDNEVFEDVTQTTCYDCHKTLVSKKNSHAPASNWLCTECHDGEFGEYNMQHEGASKYLVRDPVKRSCEGCHEPAKAWDHSKYTHGPVNDGRCERCHNPHGSDNEFFLRKPIWELCTTCHAEKAEGKHVISSFVFGSSHPTQGKPDPSRPGRELVCSGCHNPHGSTGIHLLRMKGSVPFGVCQRCHDKR
ncbi:MAG: cytochrome c3 family protein [Campylobacterota bacterium]